MYNVDFVKLMLWIIPQALHKTKLLAYVSALLTPIKVMLGEFQAKRVIDLYKLAHNSQVCYLEAALRDSFDNLLRRIVIEDGNRYNRLYIYTNAENRPKYLGKIFIHNRDDYSDTGLDFIVKVPLDLKNNINEFALKALIDFYRLDSKRYKIVYE